MGWNRGWEPYVPVAKRRAQAAKELEKLDKQSNGKTRSPVKIATRKMAVTFWGEAWCKNLENYSDYSNRLPRGKTYARNGSIFDLQIEKGCVTAMVCGSSLYRIRIEIATLPLDLWNDIKSQCSRSIHSVLDLLRGKLSDSILECLTAPKVGLFPQPKEIQLRCSCPDSAKLCKHLAAVMYGIGNRLDTSPEFLFLLRGVDKDELVSEAVSSNQWNDPIDGSTKSKNSALAIADEDLGSLFGIDLVSPEASTVSDFAKSPKKKASRSKLEATQATTKSIASQGKKAKPAQIKSAVIARSSKGRAGNEPTSPALPVSLRIAMEKLERTPDKMPKC
jgi:uncharacterized Zn finger protein